jgi:hypothetical protein
MAHRTVNGALILVLLACNVNQATAENARLTLMFGGTPGSPLTYAYNDGAPTQEDPNYTLRIEVIDLEIKKVFYDTILSVTLPDKIIQSVTAARAYRTLRDCNEARAAILDKLAEALPRAGVGDAEWQRQSADGTVVGRAVCEQRHHYPMPVLRLTIALP